ncbi:hypothetical protein M9Y10_016468 [Tritrichomonas musculus]|uniref:RING-type domain-containing protein n=1 Tax=Tritrichomonas musculus TaxID=1915356 RepID=A0ABR2HWN2_9EUKA
MGNNSSNAQSPLSTTVRSNNSYFGSSPEVGEASDRDLASTIRDLNLERLYSRSPNMRPTQETQEPPQQLKAVISFTNPTIKIVDKNIQIYDLCFELHSEAPGRLVIISNGEINSLNFEITKNEPNQKIRLSLPLPLLSNFNVELHPDLEHAKTQLDAGFQFVPKHEFIFQISQSESDFQIILKEQRLHTADDKILSIPINSAIPIENCFDYDNIMKNTQTPSNNDPSNSLIEFDNSTADSKTPDNPDVSNKENKRNIPCLVCLQKEADTAIADCGHLVVCDDCLCKRALRLHHCPICNKPTSF